jgi:shikimate kinase
MKEYVEAEAYATANMVEVAGKSAAFALDMKTTASASLREDGKIIAKDATAKEVVEKVLALLGYSCGVEVTLKTEIPKNKGFGEDAAAAVATALAVSGAVAKKFGTINELKIDIHTRDQFMIIEEKLFNKKKLVDLCSEGMRADRVYASFYGGFAISENGRILRHGEMEMASMVILAPKKVEKLGEDDMMVLGDELDIIFQQALSGNLNTAMNMNATLLAKKMALKMLKAGAMAVSAAKEGGLVAINRDEKKAEEIADALKLDGSIITKKASNSHAKIIINPKRIYKINEFMALKGDQPYDWI